MPADAKLKADISFGGHTPITTAASSDEALSLPRTTADGAAADEGVPAPAKMWRQIGRVQEHMAIQIQAREATDGLEGRGGTRRGGWARGGCAAGRGTGGARVRHGRGTGHRYG